MHVKPALFFDTPHHTNHPAWTGNTTPLSTIYRHLVPPYIIQHRHTWNEFVICFSQQSFLHTFNTPGQMISADELQCPLPPISPTSDSSLSPVFYWNISVSNDGTSYSNPLQLIIFDSKCQNCSSNGICLMQVWWSYKSLNAICTIQNVPRDCSSWLYLASNKCYWK